MKTYNNVSKIVTTVFLFTITGCSANLNIFSNLSDSHCPLKPTTTLLKENIQELDLESNNLITSVQTDTNKNIGYVFQVKSGQKLNYNINNSACLWLFNSENDLLNNPRNKTVSDIELTQSGKYVLQISTLNNFSNVDIEVNLGLSKKEAVTLLETWYQSKKQVFGQALDISKLDLYAVGIFKASVLKTRNSINQNKCYYKFNKTAIEDIVAFNNIPERPILIVKVYEDYERYNTSKNRQCPRANSPYRATITYLFEKDNGKWKIYDYKLVDN